MTLRIISPSYAVCLLRMSAAKKWAFHVFQVDFNEGIDTYNRLDCFDRNILVRCWRLELRWEQR